MRRHCTATTKAGRPCRAYAVDGTDPPRCAPHGGGKAPVGAPAGNKNAQTHGAYSESITLEDALRGLTRRIRNLEKYLDDRQEDLTSEERVNLVTLYSNLLGRLGRLMRDQRAISGEAADGIAGAIAQALDELSTELGADL